MVSLSNTSTTLPKSIDFWSKFSFLRLANNSHTSDSVKLAGIASGIKVLEITNKFK